MNVLFIENFLDESYVRLIEDSLAGDMFAWFLQRGTFAEEALATNLAIRTPDTLDTPQLTHFFVRDGSLVDHHPILSLPLHLANKQPDLRLNLMRRVKANLTFPSKHEGYYQMPHIDVSPEELRQPSLTAIYYVNDADGDTVLFKQTYDGKKKRLTVSHRFEPKRGAVLVFDSARYHAGSNPVKAPYRIVVNFDMTTRKP